MPANNPSQLGETFATMTDEQLYPFVVQQYVIRWNQLMEKADETYTDICKEYAELYEELKLRLPFLTETQKLLEDSKLALQLIDPYTPSLRYT